ncbi:MAG: hypothetical protein OXC68_12665 [Aestuariivita sp.]|nr:hypothetical protein [Aestuariivita sp.]
MRADNTVEASELIAMDIIRSQCHKGVQPNEIPIDQLPKIFTTRMGRVSFLLELVGMAYVNDDFDRREFKLIYQISDALDLSEDGSLEAILKWVKDQLGLMKRAKTLMEES